MGKITLCHWAAVASLVTAGMQPASAQSLTEAYRAALEKDPDLAGAAAERDAASENEGIASALFRPQAEIRANAGYSRIMPESNGSAASPSALPGTIDGFSGGAVALVNQSIINGEARAEARALRAADRAGRAQFESKRQDLMLRMASAYFDVLKAGDSLASLRAQSASAARELRGARERFAAGRANVLDPREAQARLDALAAQIVGAQSKLDLAKSRFSEITGLDGTAVRSVRDDLEPTLPPATLDEAQAVAETTSPTLAALRAKHDGSKATADRYRWSSQVKLSGSLAYGQIWRGGGETAVLSGITPPGRVGVMFAGLGLQVPLTSGGGLAAQYRQAADKARSAGHEVDAARRDIRLKVQEAWLGQRTGKERVSALRTALGSAQLQERAAITGREVGARTQSDVLAAQAQTLDTQRQVKEALYDYEYARLTLAAATGTLTAEVLATVNVDLDLSTPNGR
jgi:outer membrane protein